jgi:hypothetical protein
MVILVVIVEGLWQPFLRYLDLLNLVENLFLSALNYAIELLHSIKWKIEVLLKVLAYTDRTDILPLEDSSSNFASHHLVFE